MRRSSVLPSCFGYSLCWQCPITAIVATKKRQTKILDNESLKKARSCQMFKHEDRGKKLFTSLGQRFCHLLMSVNDSIKGKSISPARSEVQNIDLTVRSGGLANPAQQYLLTVGLLQI